MFDECVKIKWGKGKYLKVKELLQRDEKGKKLIVFEQMTIDMLTITRISYFTTIICYSNMIL